MEILSILLIAYTIYISPTIYYRVFNRNTKKFKSENKIALTFDDGIDENYTEELLELLYKYNIKATFFILTSTIEKNPQILDRMESEGHVIGLHSFEHKCPLFKGYFYTKRDFENSINTFKRNNIDIKYFRPPWGVFNLFTIRYMKKHGLKTVLWSVMVGDWRRTTTSQEIERKLMKKIKPGAIICLHDGRGREGAPSRTIEALERAIPLLKADYDFVTMEKVYG